MKNLLPENDKGTILIVDDDPMNIDIIAEILGKHHDILFATNGKDAMKIALSEVPDLIILDVLMSEMDGYEVCKKLKANTIISDIPVIFITGLSNVADERKGLEVGAVDYITKPISPPIVNMRINNHMKLTRALKKLSELSRTDGLTNLANRRYMDERLEKECLGMRKPESPLSFILIDIDYFKQFNDTYGHLAGDGCLIEVARTISQTANRSTDLVARYGGEEFCCILQNTGNERALKLAERIRANVLAQKIRNEDSDVNEFLTLSLGVATILPNGNFTPDEVITIADENLYTAKTTGRNKVVWKNCIE